jgi:hypothetical protein
MRRLVLYSALLVLDASLDYVTGADIKLGSFYLATAALAGWGLSTLPLCGFALAVFLTWTGVEHALHVHQRSDLIAVWNAIDRLAMVAITALVACKAKTVLKHYQSLVRELRVKLLGAHRLGELVPICKICRGPHFEQDYQAKFDELLGESYGFGIGGGVCRSCLEARSARIAAIPIGTYFPPDASGLEDAGTSAAAR